MGVMRGSSEIFMYIHYTHTFTHAITHTATTPQTHKHTHTQTLTPFLLDLSGLPALDGWLWLYANVMIGATAGCLFCHSYLHYSRLGGCVCVCVCACVCGAVCVS